MGIVKCLYILATDRRSDNTWSLSGVTIDRMVIIAHL